MTLTQTCYHCGQSRAFEHMSGDRSGLCWREACSKSRQEQARRYREKCDAYAELERRARIYPFRKAEV